MRRNLVCRRAKGDVLGRRSGEHCVVVWAAAAVIGLTSLTFAVTAAELDRDEVGDRRDVAQPAPGERIT